MIDFDSLNYVINDKRGVISSYGVGLWIVLLPGNIPYLTYDGYKLLDQRFTLNYKLLHGTFIGYEYCEADRVIWAERINDETFF